MELHSICRHFPNAQNGDQFDSLFSTFLLSSFVIFDQLFVTPDGVVSVFLDI